MRIVQIDRSCHSASKSFLKPGNLGSRLHSWPKTYFPQSQCTQIYFQPGRQHAQSLPPSMAWSWAHSSRASGFQTCTNSRRSSSSWLSGNWLPSSIIVRQVYCFCRLSSEIRSVFIISSRRLRTYLSI